MRKIDFANFEFFVGQDMIFISSTFIAANYEGVWRETTARHRYLSHGTPLSGIDVFLAVIDTQKLIPTSTVHI